MINNKGFAKFEVLTVIVLLICIGAFLLYQVLSGASSQQLSTMRDSASNFAKAVNADSNSFVNSDNVYLDEAIDSGLMNSISSPFGGKCDGSETRYFMNDGTPSVTLKCGKYLINEESVSSQQMISKQLDIHEQKNEQQSKANSLAKNYFKMDHSSKCKI